MTIENKVPADPVTAGTTPPGLSTVPIPDPPPTYEELLRLGWALLWRGIGSFVLLLFAGNVFLLFLFPELTRTTPSVWVALVPLAFATVVSVFLIMPYVAKRLVHVPFKGFHLRFVRDQAGAGMRSILHHILS